MRMSDERLACTVCMGRRRGKEALKGVPHWPRLGNVVHKVDRIQHRWPWWAGREHGNENRYKYQKNDIMLSENGYRAMGKCHGPAVSRCFTFRILCSFGCWALSSNL